MKDNAELRAMARAQLKGSWLAAVGMYLVSIIILGLSAFVAGVGPLILGGPLFLGYTGYFLKKARGETVKLEQLFDGFKQFGSGFLLYLLRFIFIILWSLLVIPGIVKYFSYAMAFYIMKDNPAVGAVEAITQSRNMMAGYKGRLFCLYLSFTGWALLCCLSLGIGFLWLVPYISASKANFYEELKNQTSAAPAVP